VLRKIQIEAEWKRSERALGAAELLLQAGYYEDAISRAYYAVLHAAKAALLARDTAAESHTVVRRLFGKELVQQGVLEKEWAIILAQQQDERTLADYDVELTLPRELAEHRVEDAHHFQDRIRSFLESAGLADLIS